MSKVSESDVSTIKKVFHVDVPSDSIDLDKGGLHDLRMELRRGTRDFLTRCKKEGRELTKVEELAWDTAMQYLDLLGDEYDERVASGTHGGGESAYLPNFRGGVSMEKLLNRGKDWRSIFGREPRRASSFKSVGEYVQALHTGDEERLRELRTMNTISGADGGFAVPEQLWSQIYDAALEVSVTLDSCMPLPMTSDSLGVPGWDSADKTQGPIGSVEGEWLGETETANRVTPRLRLVTFNARKLAMYIAASSESLQDSAALSQSLGPLMRNSLAFSLDAAVLAGSGVARPLGIINSPATISVSRATAGNITFTDCTNMVGRLLPSSLKTCMWICSPSAHSTLLGLEISSGTGMLAMKDGKILDIPVRITEKLPALAAKGSLMLVDLSYYGLAMRETGRFERTNAAQWTSDIIDMRQIIRADGKPLISKPFTPAGGGSTLSPFVVLDA